MITPKDIQGKQFSRVMRGYKDEEVDTFLDMITIDLETLLREKEELEEKIAELQKQLDGYQSADSEASKLLRQAQEVMKEVSEGANKRAEFVVHNAELEAESIVRLARDRAHRLDVENRELVEQAENFKNRYKRMLKDELSRLDAVEEKRPAEPEKPISLEDLFEDYQTTPAKKVETRDMPTIISSSIPDAPDLEADEAKETVVINIGAEL